VRRATSALLALVIGSVFLLVAAPTAAGQDDDDGPVLRIFGTLRAGDPVEGAVITVTDADDEEVEVVETDEEGAWEVNLPEPGRYTATLDVDTLPEGITLRDPERASVVKRVGTGSTPVPFVLQAEGDDDSPAASSSGRSLSDRIARAVVNGLKFGLIIAITSIGLSLIFGTTGLVNFAHGELVTFGAIAAWVVNLTGPRIHLVWATALAVAAGVLLGLLLERGLWRPLRARRTGQFQLLVISIGLALILRHIWLIWFGSASKRYAQYGVQRPYDLGPVSVTARDLIVMLLCVVALVGVALLLQRTRIGKAMRAVSDNVDLAESSGIDVKRVILVVWGLGAGLAALGGVLQALMTSVNYLNGTQLLLLMFAGVILGGLGTAYGAMVGGLVVGLATEVSTVWLNAELKYVWALAALIVVLLFRPQGILGARERVG
jgi:neutral amino acid transport system permease protein